MKMISTASENTERTNPEAMKARAEQEKASAEADEKMAEARED